MSPNPNHLESSSKEHPAQTYWTPTWDWKTLYCSSAQTCLEKERQPTVEEGHYALAREAYSKFSGIPRRCFRAFDLNDNGIANQVYKIKEAIDNIDNLSRLLATAVDGSVYLSEKTHLLLRVEPIEGDWSRWRTTLLSDFVGDLILPKMHLRYPSGNSDLRIDPPATP
ncbi:hypothetical protein BOTBODRAFT_169486 [Botryobasidium botryosum FD-172 SS1]|uniref:Uncharacterized protein n=1 Tax=Botryobasidium botryosum (strain FD-172 SS1) TaxID=930990 RepID=A0A067NAG4_BOTB1|nr:hypothetical protein BOTBODRAFT_169486 [Botryobasidium botryosum FD-172 SS1]